jgi:hypothetical protein
MQIFQLAVQLLALQLLQLCMGEPPPKKLKAANAATMLGSSKKPEAPQPKASAWKERPYQIPAITEQPHAFKWEFCQSLMIDWDVQDVLSDARWREAEKAACDDEEPLV